MKTTDTFTYTTKWGTSYKDCYFKTNEYNYPNNKYLAIGNEKDGLIITCSVNANRFNAEDEIGIKNYSENEGMVDFLIGMGIIEPAPIAVEHSGWIEIPYFKLTESGKELFKNND